MPATRRTARACALVLATLGLTVASVVTGPSMAAAAPVAASDPLTSDEALDIRVQGPTASERVARRVVNAKNTAMAQRGDRYSYGAAGPHSFDCSGLIYYSYRKAGFAVPRTSGAQAAHTRRIAKKDMRAGDLMFFHSGGRVYHAAVFLGWKGGAAQMVHAPGSGRSVQVARPWTSSWYGGTLRRP